MFEPIPNFSIGDFGLYWSTIKTDFPTCVSQEALDPGIELFDTPPMMSFQIRNEPPLPRCVYRHKDGRELVQVQTDRFSFNWLRANGEGYPRYEATASRFWDMFDGFSRFLEERGYALPRYVQCEIANVNVVRVSDFAGDLAQTLTAVGSPPLDLASVGGMSVEAIQVAQHYLLRGDDSRPIGRLHTNLLPVLDVGTREAAIRFDLTARGAPFGPDRRGVEAFFECGRTAINAAFLAVTTDSARSMWGETQ